LAAEDLDVEDLDAEDLAAEALALLDLRLGADLRRGNAEREAISIKPAFVPTRSIHDTCDTGVTPRRQLLRPR
jgi:hypothetical protein